MQRTEPTVLPASPRVTLRRRWLMIGMTAAACVLVAINVRSRPPAVDPVTQNPVAVVPRTEYLSAPLQGLPDIAVVTAVAWWLAVPVLYVEAQDRLTDGLTLPSLNVFKNVPLGELVWARAWPR